MCVLGGGARPSFITPGAVPGACLRRLLAAPSSRPGAMCVRTAALFLPPRSYVRMCADVFVGCAFLHVLGVQCGR
jgi:hypothetical protein